MDFLLLIILILSVGGLTYWAHHSIRGYVMSTCPEGTFLSGESDEYWVGFAAPMLSTCLAFGIFAFIDRIRPVSSYYRNTLLLPWSRQGWTVFMILTVGTLAAFSFMVSAQFCLAADGIYSRNLPWKDFQRYSWSNVKKIEVDCRDRRREPDLRYTLIFQNGTQLDIADGIPSWKPSPQFVSQLAEVPFQFTADVRPNCPMPYVDWVGQKP